jgi:predicted HicB family RNase H-like nuclease
MMIDGYQAVFAYDPEIQIFRGEFVSLNGGADFYSADADGLEREGAISLRVFLQPCERQGIEPHGRHSRQAS